jgi:putative ABC transport system substrate-binding protein
MRRCFTSDGSSCDSPHPGWVRLVMNSSLVALVMAVVLVVGSVWAEAPPDARGVRLGYLSLGSPAPETIPLWNAFLLRLGELGWVVGRNVAVERRSAEGRAERLEALAAELVELKVDLIIAAGTSAVIAAKRSTRSIPIIIAGASDPVGFGLVTSLARPGRNITGLSDSPGREIEGKRLQLLKEVVPNADRIGVVLDSSGRRDPRPMQQAAQLLGIGLLMSLETTNQTEFRTTFAALKRDGADAIYAPETPVNVRHRDLIVELATEYRLPAIYGSREFVDAGGVMSYGTSFPELYRRLAVYVDKILRGTRPNDLPVEQPSQLELAVNLKTAKALGIRLPQTILQRVEHVVQ